MIKMRFTTGAYRYTIIMKKIIEFTLTKGNIL